MKYAVFQVDDSRQHYVDQLHTELSDDKFWEEVSVPGVDGRVPEILSEAMERHPYAVHADTLKNFPLRGHLGIWYTVLDALEHAPIVTFEDDAILMEVFFSFEFKARMRELPADADFFALFIPRDSDHLFTTEFELEADKVCKIYQNYGGVSMFYTERGREKIKKLLMRDGLTDQYDNTLMAYAKAGELNGYTSKPRHPDLVRISGTDTSIVQETEYAG